MFLLNGTPLPPDQPFTVEFDVAYKRLSEETRFYCTGKPCKRGHYSNRYVCNNECVQCRLEKNFALKEKQKKWAEENRERKNLLSKKRYYENIEQEQARSRQKWIDNPDKIKQTNKAWSDKNPKIWSHYAAKRRSSLRQRTPLWANLEAIKQFYLNCPDGYHVDHIIPLRGKTVSGLHVLNNLQYLPASENMRKFNKLEDQYVYSR
jgi:hypothetical protein